MKVKCMNCKGIVILEECECIKDYYGRCSVCGYTYLVTKP